MRGVGAEAAILKMESERQEKNSSFGVRRVRCLNPSWARYSGRSLGQTLGLSEPQYPHL